MSTRRASAAISPCDSSHGGAITQPMMPPISMLALMRRPMIIPEPMLSSETPNPRPTRAENAFTASGNVVDDPPQLRGEEQQPREHQRADHHERRLARLLAARVEHDQRLSRGDAVRERQVLILDEVLAQRHREQHAEQSGRRQPDERLHAREVDVEAAARFGREDVERREQPAQKRDLSGRRAGSLDDVVFPAVVVLRERPSAMNPKKAETTEMFGPKPNLRTT